MAKETGFFRGPGGTIFKMDLPLSENMAAQVASGALSPVTGNVVERPGGEGEGTHYVLVHEPADDVEADPDAVPNGTVADVIAWAEADPANRALKALGVEMAKGDKARSSLVKALGDLTTAQP